MVLYILKQRSFFWLHKEHENIMHVVGGHKIELFLLFSMAKNKGTNHCIHK
jgi:hypothetical protein